MTFSRYSADDVSRGAMLDTPFTRLVGCQVPIQQAGMGGIANVELAAESPAHPVYIDALLGATAADTTVTTAFSVMWPDAPHRVLRASIEAMLAFEGDIVGEMHMGEERMPIPRGAVPTPQRDMVGTIEAMPMYAGESVDGIASRQTAKAIIDELADGAEDLLRSWR